MQPEKVIREVAKVMGKRGGVKTAKKLTPEQMSERGRKGGIASGIARRQRKAQ